MEFEDDVRKMEKCLIAVLFNFEPLLGVMKYFCFQIIILCVFYKFENESRNDEKKTCSLVHFLHNQIRKKFNSNVFDFSYF